jgi:hypothetical protein
LWIVILARPSRSHFAIHSSAITLNVACWARLAAAVASRSCAQGSGASARSMRAASRFARALARQAGARINTERERSLLPLEAVG